MADPNLHVQARRGYKYTGATVALNMLCREAKDVWQELGMRQLIKSAVAEVETNFKAGCLPWTFKTMRSLIPAYPRMGAS